jgi:hypothetical protein
MAQQGLKIEIGQGTVIRTPNRIKIVLLVRAKVGGLDSRYSDGLLAAPRLL